MQAWVIAAAAVVLVGIGIAIFMVLRGKKKKIVLAAPSVPPQPEPVEPKPKPKPAVPLPPKPKPGVQSCRGGEKLGYVHPRWNVLVSDGCCKNSDNTSCKTWKEIEALLRYVPPVVSPPTCERGKAVGLPYWGTGKNKGGCCRNSNNTECKTWDQITKLIKPKQEGPPTCRGAEKLGYAHWGWDANDAGCCKNSNNTECKTWDQITELIKPKQEGPPTCRGAEKLGYAYWGWQKTPNDGGCCKNSNNTECKSYGEITKLLQPPPVQPAKPDGCARAPMTVDAAIVKIFGSSVPNAGDYVLACGPDERWRIVPKDRPYFGDFMADLENYVTPAVLAALIANFGANHAYAIAMKDWITPPGSLARVNFNVKLQLEHVKTGAGAGASAGPDFIGIWWMNWKQDAANDKEVLNSRRLLFLHELAHSTNMRARMPDTPGQGHDVQWIRTMYELLKVGVAAGVVGVPAGQRFESGKLSSFAVPYPENQRDAWIAAINGNPKLGA